MPVAAVQHQPRAVALLARALSADRIPHSYLFAGPDGVGKTLLARQYAAVLLCQKPGVATAADPFGGGPLTHREACGSCAACKLLAGGNHPDLHVVHRQLKAHSRDERVRRSRGVELSIEVLREFLMDKSAEKSVMGGYKVFVVQEAERMSMGAQNALLKTLEEPPPRTVIILLTPHEHRLLPTTQSRCQKIPFVRLPEAFIVDRLVGQGTDAATARFLARLADGSLGAALTLLADDVAGFKRSWLASLVRLDKRTQASGLGELAKSFAEVCDRLAEHMQRRDKDASGAEAQRESARGLFALLSTFLRDALWLGAGGDEDRLVHADQVDVVRQAAARWPRPALLSRVEAVHRAERILASNVNVPLNVEVLLNTLAA